MSTAPPVRYARADGADLAYQIFGNGGPDVMAIPPFAQNIELMWDRPEMASMFESLGSFARWVHFDKRGTGASDRTVAVPTLDERVEDMRAVMDAAGIERAVVYGVSEGGPMAVLFAATYPERVTALVLHATAARFVRLGETEADRVRRDVWVERFVARWGTDRSVTLRAMAPSVADDPSYIAWEQRYERQSATPRGVREIFTMLYNIDVTPLLPQLTLPTLIVHRSGDRVARVEGARLLADHIPGARLAEFDGEDHFPHIGDTAGWLTTVEMFITGTSTDRPRRPGGTRTPHITKIRTLGGFCVNRDGHDIAASEWGSRRARQLCKRLAAAAGSPVPREQLIEMLWPDDPETPGRLGARLSVQLSTVRRILGGGVIADRTSIRLDPTAVRIDIVDLAGAIRAGDFDAALRCYGGPFLPEDPYDDWTVAARQRAHASFVTAARQLVTRAHTDGHLDQALGHALHWLSADQHDDQAHHAVIGTYLALGRRRATQRAHDEYRQRMSELGVPALSLDAIARNPP